jgi:hypothetical protein
MTQVPETYVEAAEGDLAEDVPVIDEPEAAPRDDLELGIETPEADAVEQTLPAPFDEDDEHR